MLLEMGEIGHFCIVKSRTATFNFVSKPVEVGTHAHYVPYLGLRPSPLMPTGSPYGV